MKLKNIASFATLLIICTVILPSEEKKQKRRSFFHKKTTTITTETTTTTPYNPLKQKSYDTALITATRNNDSTKVHRLLMNDIRINEKGDDGLTALHIAAQNKNENIVLQLLQDVRTNASIKTINGHTARELVGTNKEDFSLRNKLFARVSLEMAIDKRCHKIKKKYYKKWDYKKININSECIKDALKKIEISIATYETNQEETPQATSIPEDGRQPAYVDGTFILCMIMYRLYQ